MKIDINEISFIKKILKLNEMKNVKFYKHKYVKIE